MEVRTRFAPSPTGYLHIGALRTILYCYAQARHNDGSYVMRIEDTDRTRYMPETVDSLFDVQEAYGITIDESSKTGGEYGPYVQSERLDIYKKYAEELIEKDYAFYCFLTQEETKKLQVEFMKENKRFRSPYRDGSIEDAKKRIEAGDKYTVRLKVPTDRTFTYTDGVQGTMSFHSDEIVDQVLMKQHGFPTYHMAVAVDDHLMKISHVFRGFEWIPSTPIQILTYEGLGFDMPQHYHLSTILDPNGGKLSKRKGATFASEFLKDGYLPEAMLNFLMLLGWSAPIEREHGESEREIFSLEEFVELFEPKDLNKTNPVFDITKLNWFNKEYIKSKDTSELTEYLKSWINDYEISVSFKDELLKDSELDNKVALLKERSGDMREVLEGLRVFYESPESTEWEIKQLKRVWKVDGKKDQLLQQIKELITSFSESTSEWTHEEWETGMRAIGDKTETKHGDVFMVLRVAIAGGPVSPPLFEALQILGKEEIVARISK